MCRTHFTILLLSSLMNEVVHTSPTIGSNVEEIVVKNTHFLMWDIGGQESLRSSWNTYYSNTEVSGMFSDFSFFTESHNRRAEVLSGSWRVCSAHIRQQGRPRPKVVFWTKVPAWKAERQIRFSAGRGSMIAEADVKDNPGVWQPARPSVPLSVWTRCGIFDTASAHAWFFRPPVNTGSVYQH